MLKVLCKSSPTHLTLLATPIEPFSYHFDCQLIKLLNTHEVFADTIILIMTSQFGCKYLPPVFCFEPVSNRSKPIVHIPAFCREFLTTCLSTKFKITSARDIAIMRKTQKVKCVGFAVLFSGIFSFKVPKSYLSALCRMNFQAVLTEPVL